MCGQYFTNKDVDNLSMSGAYNLNGNGTTSWYDTTPGVECYVGDRALKIDRETKTVISEAGRVSHLTRKPCLRLERHRPSPIERAGLTADAETIKILSLVLLEDILCVCVCVFLMVKRCQSTG